MARDAGVLATAGTNPAGTIASTGVRVKITDPLDANSDGFGALRPVGGGTATGIDGAVAPRG